MNQLQIYFRRKQNNDNIEQYRKSLNTLPIPNTLNNIVFTYFSYRYPFLYELQDNICDIKLGLEMFPQHQVDNSKIIINKHCSYITVNF
jgi:hypothetical protein